LVLGSTAVAAYFHRTTESSERDERSDATARTSARRPIFDRECLPAQWGGSHRVPRVPKNQTSRLLACSWVGSRFFTELRPRGHRSGGTRSRWDLRPTMSDAACSPDAACYSPCPRSSERWSQAFPIGKVHGAHRRRTEVTRSGAPFYRASRRCSSLASACPA